LTDQFDWQKIFDRSATLQKTSEDRSATLLLIFKKFSSPMMRSVFLLHITTAIANCNSSTPDTVGGLIPRLSEEA
jgi:hypothetical protein